MKWQRQPYVLNDGEETVRYVNGNGDQIIKWPTMLSRGRGKPRGQWLARRNDDSSAGCWTTLKEAKQAL